MKKLRRKQLELEETFGFVIKNGSSAISLGYKGMYRAKTSGELVSYRIDSEDTAGDPVTGSITIAVKKNGTLMGNAVLSSASSINQTDLSAWVKTFVKEDKITFEVTSVTGVNNAVITLYYK